MICQLCDKQATVHLTEIVNGEKFEKHLCEICAQKEGITAKGNSHLGALLNNLVEAHDSVSKIGSLVCPECGMSWDEFRRGGLLGCPNDYLVFAEPIVKLICKAQEGADRHIGRIPKRTDNQQGRQVIQLRLRKELQEAVENEDYEKAAQIRDELHDLSLSGGDLSANN